ncbi:restriction endonuclease subunit S [Pectobacterium aroidearum]|uniref:restriction endonuclease subunit S n=1 Tax=Pectobacterium aroidearum TaxID=1201031 RepID=UPI0032EDB585
MSWPMVEIGSVVSALSGFAWKSSNYTSMKKNAMPIIRIQNVGECNTPQDFVYWDEQYDNKYIVSSGDILVSLSGNVKVGIWEEPDALLNQRIVKLVPGDEIDKDYFYYSVLNNVNDISNLGKKAVISNISVNDLKKIVIPLPPLSVQKKISVNLKNADLLKKQYEKMSAELNALAQAVFFEMFGDPERNSKKLPFKEFKNLLSELRNGISPSNDGAVDYKVLTLSAVTKNYFNRDSVKLGTFNEIPPSSKHIKVNDLLICRGNGNIKLVGRAVVAGGNMGDVVFPDTIIGASVNQEIINTEYLSHYWKLPMVRNHIESGARTTNGTYKINQKVIESIPIMVPSIELQIEFAQKIAKIKLLMSLSHDKEAMLNSYFNGFMQHAFSGKLDLKKVA